MPTIPLTQKRQITYERKIERWLNDFGFFVVRASHMTAHPFRIMAIKGLRTYIIMADVGDVDGRKAPWRKRDQKGLDYILKITLSRPDVKIYSVNCRGRIWRAQRYSRVEKRWLPAFVFRYQTYSVEEFEDNE